MIAISYFLKAYTLLEFFKPAWLVIEKKRGLCFLGSFLIFSGSSVAAENEIQHSKPESPLGSFFRIDRNYAMKCEVRTEQNENFVVEFSMENGKNGKQFNIKSLKPDIFPNDAVNESRQDGHHSYVMNIDSRTDYSYIINVVVPNQLISKNGVFYISRGKPAGNRTQEELLNTSTAYFIVGICESKIQ